MIREKHSINKVILTVDTNNKKTAFQLKDNLSVFLKQEIFPYLAKYFDNLVKDVNAEVIQIEQLNLEINITDNQSFTILKSDLKNEIEKNITNKISSLIKEKKNTKLISVQDNKLKSFFYFLDEGILPWWNEQQQKKSFVKEDLLELVKDAKFKKRFKQKIKNKLVQHRLINQFYNDELIILCEQTFNQLKTEKELVKVLATVKFSKLKNKLKKTVWLLIFEYFNTRNSNNTLRKLIEFVQVKKEQKETIKSELLNLEAIVLKLITVISDQPISQLTDLNLIKDVETSNANIYKHKTDIVKENTTIKKSIDENKTKENIEIDKSKNKKLFKENKNEENLKTNNEHKIKDLKNQQIPEEKQIVKTDKSSKIAQERSEIKKSKEKNSVDDKENRISKEEVAMNKEKVAMSKEEDTMSKEEIAMSKEEDTISKEEVAMNKEKVAMSKEEDTMSKEEIAMSKEEVAMSKEEDIMSEEEIAMSKEDIVVSKEESMMSKEKVTISQEEDNSKENNVFKDDNNVNDKEEISYINELDPNVELPEVITNSLFKNEETIEEVFFENPKETYYIKNAGLILIHPFLKQFFQNSNLLTKEGDLKDKELAVHLLHYIATKEENQLESNLIFEKFICGIPIKKPIDRKIKISKELKDQTEELLKAVLQNWEVLSNSSTDLLRFEFLQRAGKLSLEKDNPKIVVERKTQDILLDKIPWNIGICKIPWLPKLLFTDW